MMMGLDKSRYDNRSDQWRKRTGARRSRARGEVLRRLRRLIAAQNENAKVLTQLVIARAMMRAGKTL
ncbi:MAG: hypothetical protein EOS28_26715 [Mesorhizobium sp.]|nr:MAG: hypothetical protein EOS28_26715 [Mesorhizobium sp.]RWF04498.1 MAG: hypothetical protein EOS68_02510 [Mesorhizobium sp.]